jgi:hypothetical protein
VSLISGNEILPVDIPFKSLFKQDRYFSFIEKYWYDVMKQELLHSYSCCDQELKPDDEWLEKQCYDVSDFYIKNSNLVLTEYTWGPSGYCWLACSINIFKEIPLDEIRSNFNEFGLKIMVLPLI